LHFHEAASLYLAVFLLYFSEKNAGLKLGPYKTKGRHFKMKVGSNA